MMLRKSCGAGNPKKKKKKKRKSVFCIFGTTYRLGLPLWLLAATNVTENQRIYLSVPSETAVSRNVRTVDQQTSVHVQFFRCAQSKQHIPHLWLGVEKYEMGSLKRSFPRRVSQTMNCFSRFLDADHALRNSFQNNKAKVSCWSWKSAIYQKKISHQEMQFEQW